MPNLFPPLLLPDYGSAEDDQWDEVIQRSTTGVVQVRQRRTTAPRWVVEGAWQLDGPNFATVEEFLRGLQGAGADCYLYTFNTEAWWPDVSAGSGDGTKTDFAFPGRDLLVATAIVKVAGTAKTRGLHFELGIENRLTQTEDFSQTGSWPAINAATVTRTSGQGDPEGSGRAWRIQTSGGTGVWKVGQTGPTPPSGQRTYLDVWVRNRSLTKNLRITDGVSTTTVPPSSGWTRVQLLSTSSGLAATCWFGADLTADALDFDVYEPWLALESATFGIPAAGWGYLPTYASALAADTTTGKWRVAFFTAYKPTAGQAVTVSFQGRRLLLGRVVGRRPRVAVEYGTLGRGVVFEGEEA